MFLGTFITTFSGKNRIILPKKLRVELQGESIIVLTRGFNGEIWGFTRDDFAIEAEKQLAFPLTEEKGRMLRRFTFAQAEQSDLDKQGRFVIPEFLSEYAKLNEKIVLVGAGDHFEIWSEEEWRSVEQKVRKISEQDE